MIRAYYNECDTEKAEWIRELIKAGVVACGDVDERRIEDVCAEDLAGYTQCHFFAGIGVWSYALRLVGWPDTRFVWTGSCPCPSFSCAGKGKGFDDPRHLWPDWFRLVRESKPDTIFGEQADDAIGHGWLDLVQTDLEAEAYSVGAVVLGAHSVGAPHIRQRLYFVGTHAESGRLQQYDASERPVRQSDTRRESCGGPNTKRDGRRSDEQGREAQGRNADGRDCEVGHGSNGHSNRRNQAGSSIAASGLHGLVGNGDFGEREHTAQERSEKRPQLHGEHDGMLVADGRESGNVRDSDSGRCAMHRRSSRLSRHAERPSEMFVCGESNRKGLEGYAGDERDWRGPGWLDPQQARSIAASGATCGFWANCDWWYGRDGKYRPIEPGLFPLAHGASNRVLKLRGYGDAIVPQVAAAFIEAAGEIMKGTRHGE